MFPKLNPGKRTLSQLEQYLSKAAWILKGPSGASDFKTYIFPMLFFKRICDVYYEEFAEQHHPPMSFNELNAVEHFIIQKLSGKNLNAADPTSSVVKDDEAVYGTFPWKYRSAAQLARPSDQVMLEGGLREALIRINPESGAVLSPNTVCGNLI